MLSKISKNILRKQNLIIRSFGAQKEVTLDKNATWIKYRSNRKLMAFDGIIDTHVQAPAPKNDDPFVHLKTNGILSMENLIYNDPYYHDPDH